MDLNFVATLWSNHGLQGRLNLRNLAECYVALFEEFRSLVAEWPRHFPLDNKKPDKATIDKTGDFVSFKVIFLLSVFDRLDRFCCNYSAVFFSCIRSMKNWRTAF